MSLNKGFPKLELGLLDACWVPIKAVCFCFDFGEQYFSISEGNWWCIWLSLWWFEPHFYILIEFSLVLDWKLLPKSWNINILWVCFLYYRCGLWVLVICWSSYVGFKFVYPALLSLRIVDYKVRGNQLGTKVLEKCLW